MNACPNINPLNTPRPAISNTIGHINTFGDIRGIDNRLIGRANMFGDVELFGVNRTTARIDTFGTLRTGINDDPLGRISGSLPRPLLRNDFNINEPLWEKRPPWEPRFSWQRDW